MIAKALANVRVPDPVFVSWVGVGSKPCTLGFNLVRYMGTFDDTIATARYLVTAAHCTQSQWAVDSNSATQGGPVFAQEVADPTPFTGYPCGSGKYCRYSDASVFTYTNLGSIASYDAQVALPGTTGDTSFTGYVTTTTTESPYVGMGATMVGSVSGRQGGAVTHACVDILVPGFSNSSYELLCQVEASYFAQNGDSGAPVLTLHAGGVASATGIHILTAMNQSGVTRRYFSPTYAFRNELYDAYPNLRQLNPVVY